MQLDEILVTFVNECHELLEAMESTLLALDLSAVDAEQINAIFRTAHTIKGSAGLFGLDHVVAFTHVLESVLDRVRDGNVPFTESLRALLLSCADHLRTMIDAIADGQTGEDQAVTAQGAPLVASLSRHLPDHREAHTGVPGTADGAPACGDASVARAPAGGKPGATPHWHISIRFGADTLRNGMDPLSFLQYLAQFGQVLTIVPIADAIPAFRDMDPETCYLGFEIALQSEATLEQIESVFKFVREDALLRIIPPFSPVGAYVHLIDTSPEHAGRIGDVLITCGSLDAMQLRAERGRLAGEAVQVPEQTMQADPEPEISAPQTAAETGKPRRAGDARTADVNSIRVDADKLDHLINRVGELIISAASTNMFAMQAGLPDLQDRAANLANLVKEVRDGALQLRMVRIGGTFNRFQRMVHDLSRELGKDVRLQIQGEDTELDKTLVERIGDPLTHLVRNAMDHGIADPAYRAARGKPPYGTITLNAYHDSGSVVIEVGDDGRGLNRDRILAKATERGLVPAGAILGDEEIFGLIFEPGFSTADQVTNLSGRGVGMDVVKRNITALRGTVGISSTPGVGTTIRIRLPLTLAIIDGFLAQVGNASFVVPLDMVEECMELSPAARAARHARGFVDLRGSALPLIPLRDVLESGGTPGERENLLVVNANGQRAGLLVDNLLGEVQAVIKPLGPYFRSVKVIGGSTILGDGQVALILDVPGLLRYANALGTAVPA